MAKAIDNEIKNLTTSWEGFKGSRVEEFIKYQLSKLGSEKFGYLNIESGEGGLQTMRFFANEEAFTQWFGDRTLYADKVLKEFSFYSNKPEESYTLRTVITRYPATSMAQGSRNTLALSYNCYWGDNPAEKDTADGEATVEINGVEIAQLTHVLKASGTAQANTYEFDLSDYLKEETNKVKVVVSNSHGARKEFLFNIKTYNIALSFDNSYDESVIQSGKWSLRVNSRGVEALVYCRVEDGKRADTYTKSINNSSGEFIIDELEKYSLGAHNISIWAENKQLGLRTQTLTTTYIKGVKNGNGQAALSLGKGFIGKVKQFSVVNIPYFFYLPDDDAGSKARVKVQLKFNGETLDLLEQEVTLKLDKSSGLQSVNITLDDNRYLPFVDVVISVGQLSVTRRIEVETIGISIVAADECKVYIPMRGRANNDLSAQNITSLYKGVQTSRLVRSENFVLDENNGFLDGQGLTIKAGKSVTLKDFLPFATDIGANGNKQGRTIELELESGVCSNESAIIAQCFHAGVGFRIYPGRIEFGCATDSVTTYFPEGSRVKVSFVIDGTTTHTRNNLGGGSVTEKDVNLAYLYINGVIVRMFDYTSASWKQGVAKELTIGSEQADVKLYSIRIYDKALNFKQVLDNFAYDTPDIEDVYDDGTFVRFGKISIARRNDILNTSGDIHNPDEIISFDKVKKALPTTPIAIWNIDELPYNKNNPNVAINATEFLNPTWNKSTDGNACAPFKVGAHLFNADGTSSNGYPSPYKNWAEIFENGDGSAVEITLDPEHSNEKSTSYSITPGVEQGEKEVVHKVNFASSEGIFNILAMNLFQEILLNTAKTNTDLYTAFQRAQAESSKPVTFRKSLSGFPEIGFRKTSSSGSKSPVFLSIYNLINNKYSASFMGFPAKDYKKAQIWEVDENVNFFNREITDASLDGGSVVQSNATSSKSPIYYARVPKKSPVNKKNKLGAVKSATDNIAEANKEIAVIKRFHNWVVSCNPHLAERYKVQHGEYRTLETAVTYNGVRYTKDTPSYRKARFVNTHQDYLNKVDAIFYFIFNQFIIGMDSFDKNMSIAFDDIELNTDGSVRKATARLFERDTDSQSMFNNSGVLAFKYWAEWNDAFNPLTGETEGIQGEVFDNDNNAWQPKLTSGFSPVFNGRLSGLIDLIHECWSDDIATMYKAMRDAGLNATYMFKRYQDYWKKWCENLYNADAMGYANTGHFTKAYGDKLKLMEYFLTKRSRYLDSKYCCGSSVVNNLRLRLYETGKGLAIKHYSPMYASVQWGANNFSTVRSIKGEYGLLPFGFTNPQDATFDIDDADMITDLKTYSTKASGDVIYHGLEGLGDFKFDQNMTLLKSLEELIMNYSEEKPNTNERGVSFDLSKCGMLKKVIVRNVVNLRSLINLSSGVLQEVDFSGTPIKGVVMPENSSLTKLVLPESITTLKLKGLTSLKEENLKLAGISNIDTYEFANCPKINGLELLQKIYKAGAPLSNVTLGGVDFTTSDVAFIAKLAEVGANVTGKITFTSNVKITYEQKRAFVKAWGDIDDESNKLYISYEKFAVTNIYISGELYIASPKDVQLYAEVRPERGNNIKSLRWSISENNFATIDEDKGVLKVRRVGNESDLPKPEAQVKVTAHLTDGTILNATEVVGFYERGLALGDYVYSDGSFSNKLRKDLTVVGICYYISEDKNDRRILSLEQIRDTAGIDSFRAPFSNVQLTDKPSYPVHFVPGVKQINSEAEARRYDGLSLLASDTLDHRAGEKLPVGKIDTLLTIKHRDVILQDSGVNLPIPVANSVGNEYNNLLSLMNIHRPRNNNDVDESIAAYYYPAYSLCYAFEPGLKGHNESLSATFKAHEWYLPAVGEAIYIMEEYLKAESGIFAQAIRDGLFSLMSFTVNSNGVKNTPLLWTSSQRVNFGRTNSVRTLRVEQKSPTAKVAECFEVNYNYSNNFRIQVLPVCQF